MIHEIYINDPSKALSYLDELKKKYQQEILLHSSENLLKEELIHCCASFGLLDKGIDELVLQSIFKVNNRIDLAVLHYLSKGQKQENFHFIIHGKVLATGSLYIHCCQLLQEYLFFVSLMEYASPFTGYEFLESLQEIMPDKSEIEIREYGINILKKYLISQYLVLLSYEGG